jgi:hypothetical protein
MGRSEGACRFFHGEVQQLVAYAQHHARLDALAPDGKSTIRAHYEAAAKRGDSRSQAALDGPEFPETLDYLWGWAMALYGRSGAGTAGFAPLSYQTLQAWSALTGNELTRWEVDALVRIDAALLHPGTED